jgi:UDP-N-acetylglucosamine--N-acetylmuramyl-(pentapeptide) pyrophosphoryl-undecaprenol N-acetylglucosamine transferase
MRIVIAAGGTGGHIFPALAVALELREQRRDASILWIGTSRSREQELCLRHGIELRMLDVSGINRLFSFGTVKSIAAFVREVNKMRRMFKKDQCDAILAFGGYVSAPVLTAARMRSIPYFLHEQNSVIGRVNRFFAGGAEQVFLSFPLASGRQVKTGTLLAGMPVKKSEQSYSGFKYPDNFDVDSKGILVSGGSQGAASMNKGLLEPMKKLAMEGRRIVWQTGTATYGLVRDAMAQFRNVYVFESMDDMYPYYAKSSIVIGRAGSSTLNEAAYFGLPCVMVPLPWAADNHQWANAGFVESQGWGIRIAQENGFGEKVVAAVSGILGDLGRYDKMCGKALDHSPAHAAGDIVSAIMKRLVDNASL